MNPDISVRHNSLRDSVAPLGLTNTGVGDDGYTICRMVESSIQAAKIGLVRTLQTTKNRTYRYSPE